MTTSTPGLIADLAAVVGAGHVIDSSTERARYARSTSPVGTTPCAIVRPDSREQVQEIVRIAGRHAVPVFPISTGRNWGYGDACAPRDGCLLIDLGRMNRIVAVDADLAYAVVEPGVTQGQLFEHLQRECIPLCMDCTGAGPDTSIIGNVLERGFGHSRYGDRASHACAFEVVLADGEVLNTGSGILPGCQGEHVYRHGLGPSLDGLFAQGNVGIVTRATIWLLPEPEHFCAFFIRLDDDSAVGALIEALRQLRLAGSVRSTVHVFNAMRLLGSATRFPWTEADGTAALEVGHPELCARLRREHAVPAWAASGSLSGTAREVRAQRAAVRKAVAAVKSARVTFISGRGYRFAGWLSRRLAGWTRFRTLLGTLGRLRLGYDLLRGRPSYDSLAGGHWRARGAHGPDRDPRDSGAGLFWLSPILPMRATAVAEVERLAKTAFARHGFEYQVTYSQVSERALCAVMSLCYDHGSAAETARAQSCHDELLRALLARGYLPYRAAQSALRLIAPLAPAHWRAAGAIKAALDPDNLIAPGRYSC